MDPQKITELANLLRQNGDKILSSEFTLTLSGSLLRALNDSFTLIADTEVSHDQSFQVVKPINAKSSVFPDLQLLHDFVQKTTLLKLTHFPSELHFEGPIDIAKFRGLRRLEVHKININQVVGIQALRGQLQHLICVKSLNCVDDIITRCGGDNSNGFVWNELQSADFSYNNLRSVDTALEFAHHLQHLCLRHNKLTSVAAIKWLPNLKTLDLSYNCLTYLPQLHAEAGRRLLLLNISNNFVEELLDVAKLDSLNSLDLSDNCLLEHSQLLPLSAIMTLTTLCLQGNPLACNPKHRQATAQYLHKQTSTVKFVLDFEPLSKAEKALTGSQKWRYIGPRMPRSSSVSINSSTASINTSDGSQFSSFGSQRSVSIRGHDNSSETEQSVETDTSVVSKSSFKSRNRVRIAVIDDTSEIAQSSTAKQKPVPKEPSLLKALETEEWLEGGNAEELLRMAASKTSEEEIIQGRQRFEEYLGGLSKSPQADLDEEELPNISSTPTNAALGAHFDSTLTPIKPDSGNVSDQTLYETCEEGDETEYKSINESAKSKADQEPDKHAQLLSLYASSPDAAQEETPVSDAEPDEETYIVYNEQNSSEAMFLTISSNFIREKDTLSERTITKWSLKILESCERVKSNTLRIIFNTIRQDKKERIYCVESSLCQELEGKLRNILSQRDLTEMNIAVYRCVNCMTQFTVEQKSKRYKTDGLRCPDCRSVYVTEVTDLSASMEKPKVEIPPEPKISPALIVEESPPVTTPILALNKEENNSIVANCRLTTAKNTPKHRSLMQTTKSSANSLNDSSSCSKITNSRSSFDSNQSVVGSSNTDRDLEFRANESDVDIISNPSQSSIEVLDPNYVQSGSRKASEERRLSQLSDLASSADAARQTQIFMERESEQLLAERTQPGTPSTADTVLEAAPAIAQVQLTESSSSGSVTDSICTSYEQQGKEKIPNLPNSPLTQSGSSQASATTPNANGQLKASTEVGSQPFSSVFQSTNLLMSSSKKLIESQATASGAQPYKFNYSNFSDIDHRLKLYFYQNKFKLEGEHIKWLAKGRIYNEQTQGLGEGLLVMSTKKVYLMEAFAAPEDDVAKWLRQTVSVTVDRLAAVEVLPWKLGLSFTISGWGGFSLLMLDMLRTDSLLLYLQDNGLPVLSQQGSEALNNYLQTIETEPVKVCALLPRCQWTCGQEQQSFEPCLLLTTATQLYISGKGKLTWLSAKKLDSSPPPLEFNLIQPMSNLVDVDQISDLQYVINFIDETQNKCEIWQLHFETQTSAECCLNAVGQEWERLFGVPFSYMGT
ncbi:serine/threonine-protein kinase 11-interacting protein isoform X1 [Drosophila bipectinata]|uniref:serine/threonine-protein kinase 11-interacting protein isoform X1 n=1 Tax=Drosophila bipectinata TaxID=42026 RepID=UPI001C8A4B85|nr:serine/threonine-protein kinase 11-interacting protein [Drosophila bipectinata]